MSTTMIAFAVGVATLGLQIVAARVAALSVGVSLYSWTGVIGGSLAGLALGSALAGRAADRAPRAARGWLVGLLSLAAVAIGPLAVLLTTPSAIDRLSEVGRIGHLAIVVILLAVAPTTLLGATGPLLARLFVRELAGGGHAIGSLWAATTAGSLVGGVLAGLVLIPGLGVRGTAVLTGGLLGLAALLALARTGSREKAAGGAGEPWSRVSGYARPDASGTSDGTRPRVSGAARLGLGAGALTLALAGQLGLASWLPHTCQRESVYQCLRVDEATTLDDRPVRILFLDGLPHTHVSLEDPLHLAHDYLFPVAELASYRQSNSPPRILLIGGGGYSLPRYYAAAYPGAAIDVLELDEAVTAIGRERLGLPVDPPFAIYHGDARRTLPALPADHRYDLAIMDAFADLMVPFQLSTVEFNREVRARLTDDGLYVALIHDRGGVGRVVPAVARTVAASFGAVAIMAAGPGVRWDRPVGRTWTIVGSASPLDADRLRGLTRPTQAGVFPGLSETMPPEVRAELLARPGPVTLTDDHAPIEQLAAPLFD